MAQQAFLDTSYNFFLETDLDEYKGKWVIICDNKVISSGTELKKIVAEAKERCGNKKFLIARIPSEETMIF